MDLINVEIKKYCDLPITKIYVDHKCWIFSFSLVCLNVKSHC